MAKELGFVLRVEGMSEVLTSFGQLERTISLNRKALSDLQRELKLLKDTGASLQFIKKYEDDIKKLQKVIVTLNFDQRNLLKVFYEQQNACGSLATSAEGLSQAFQLTGKTAAELTTIISGCETRLQHLAGEMNSMVLTNEDGQTSFEELGEQVGSVSSKLAKAKEALKQTEEATSASSAVFTKEFKAMGSSIQGLISGFDGMKRVGETLNFDEIEYVGVAFDIAGGAVEKAQLTMEGFNSSMKFGESVLDLFSTQQKVAAAGTQGLNAATVASTTGVKGFGAALKGSGLGAYVAILTALVTIGTAIFSLFMGNAKASEELNDSLEKQNKNFQESKELINAEIQLMKTRGATDEEIFNKKAELIKSEMEMRRSQIDEADKAMEDATRKERKKIEEKRDTLINQEKVLNLSLENLKSEHANKVMDIQLAGIKALDDLKIQNIKNDQQRETAALKAKQEEERKSFEERYKNLKNFEEILSQLDKQHVTQQKELSARFAEQNSALNVLNNTISKLSNTALNQLLTKQEANSVLLEKLTIKTYKLQEAQAKLTEAVKNSAAAIEFSSKTIDQEIKQLEAATNLKILLIDSEVISEEERSRKTNELLLEELKAKQQLMEKRMALTIETTDAELEAYAALSLEVKKMNEQIALEEQQVKNKQLVEQLESNEKALQEENAKKKEFLELTISDKEEYNNRVKELDNQLNEDLLANQQKLLAAKKLAANADGNVDTNEQTSIDMLTAQIETLKNAIKEAHLPTNLGLDENGLQQIAAGFEFAQGYIEKIKSSFADNAAMDMAKALGLDVEGQEEIQAGLDFMESAMGTLSGLFEKLGSEEEGGKEDSKTSMNILAKMGMDEKGQAAFSASMEVMSAGLDMLGQVFSANAQKRIQELDERQSKEIETIQNSSLSEEQKEAKIKATRDRYEKQKEAEQKKAGAKQKAVAIVQAIINGAVAVVQAFAQLGPIGGAIMTGVIAGMTAAQIAVISKQKFAKGGYIPFRQGGTIQGARHSRGGVPFMAGGGLMEAEGGEVIVNRNIWSRPEFVRTISEMNAMTGGKRFFAAGGIIPSPALPGIAASTAGQNGLNTAELVAGMRGVISQEVGSIRVVNNVVDTSSQQTRLLNQQVDNSF